MPRSTWQVPSAVSDPLVAPLPPLLRFPPSLPHSVTDAFLPTDVSSFLFPGSLPAAVPAPAVVCSRLACRPPSLSLCSPNSIACCCRAPPLPPTAIPQLDHATATFFSPNPNTVFFCFYLIPSCPPFRRLLPDCSRGCLILHHYRRQAKSRRRKELSNFVQSL